MESKDWLGRIGCSGEEDGAVAEVVAAASWKTGAGVGPEGASGGLRG